MNALAFERHAVFLQAILLIRNGFRLAVHATEKKQQTMAIMASLLDHTLFRIPHASPMLVL